MVRVRAFGQRALMVCILGFSIACSDNSHKTSVNPNPVYLPVANPVVSDPPDAGSIVLQSTVFDLAEVGYRQREFFLSGSATAFKNLSELNPDGQWAVEPGETADYQTRVVVYRPIDSADFSGTVIVEWLNVTSGFDIPPSYIAGHTEMLRAGHAWVGVSAQIVGIEGSERGLLPLYLKAANPERYDELLHPGDSFSYDMFSQVAQAVREPGNVDILEGLVPQHILATGESQSASRMTTYINAVHPLYNTFDGYMVHSRGDGSSALAQDPLTPIATPETVRIRTDLNVPVMTFETETDLFYLGYVSDRQEDTDIFRLWEVAGTAHADYYFSNSGRNDDGTGAEFATVVEDDSIAGVLKCDLPINSGPQAWVFNAAVNALDNWVRTGAEPPIADRLAVTDDQSSFIYDDLGNVIGGIRTPYVDAPAAILSGEGQEGGGFCFLFGTTQLLDAPQMASLYVDKAGYEQAVSDATDQAVDKGFLLPADAQRIKAAASLQWDSL